MVRLATGQQMATFLKGKGVNLTKLTKAQIRDGKTAAPLDSLTADPAGRAVEDTPLWFYILREAELNDGKLKGVGARIVAETFHRAIEGSQISIVRDPTWRPTLGPEHTTSGWSTCCCSPSRARRPCSRRRSSARRLDGRADRRASTWYRGPSGRDVRRVGAPRRPSSSATPSSVSVGAGTAHTSRSRPQSRRTDCDRGCGSDHRPVDRAGGCRCCDRAPAAVAAAARGLRPGVRPHAGRPRRPASGRGGVARAARATRPTRDPRARAGGAGALRRAVARRAAHRSSISPRRRSARPTRSSARSMRERGYPVEDDFDRRAADISVEHPGRRRELPRGPRDLATRRPRRGEHRRPAAGDDPLSGALRRAARQSTITRGARHPRTSTRRRHHEPPRRAAVHPRPRLALRPGAARDRCAGAPRRRHDGGALDGATTAPSPTDEQPSRRRRSRARSRGRAPRTDGEAPLLGEDEGAELGSRWESIQVTFVDDPRRAVEEADGLVAHVMQQLAEGFARERETLEGQWTRGEDVSTEDLRVRAAALPLVLPAAALRLARNLMRALRAARERAQHVAPDQAERRARTASRGRSGPACARPSRRQPGPGGGPAVIVAGGLDHEVEAHLDPARLGERLERGGVERGRVLAAGSSCYGLHHAAAEHAAPGGRRRAASPARRRAGSCRPSVVARARPRRAGSRRTCRISRRDSVMSRSRNSRDRLPHTAAGGASIRRSWCSRKCGAGSSSSMVSTFVSHTGVRSRPQTGIVWRWACHATTALWRRLTPWRRSAFVAPGRWRRFCGGHAALGANKRRLLLALLQPRRAHRRDALSCGNGATRSTWWPPSRILPIPRHGSSSRPAGRTPLAARGNDPEAGGARRRCRNLRAWPLSSSGDGRGAPERGRRSSRRRGAGGLG